MTPRRAYTPLPPCTHIYLYIFVYSCIYRYLFHLALRAHCLQGSELAPHSSPLQWCFHRCLGLSLIVLHIVHHLQPWVTDLRWVYVGHLNSSWATHGSSTLLSVSCPHNWEPAKLCSMVML